jgi:hypothetical protein
VSYVQRDISGIAPHHKSWSFEHAFAQIKANISEIDLIRAVYAAASKEYIPILTMEEAIRGIDLELKHLEEVMGKLWRHSWGKQGHLAVKTELVHLQGSAMHVRRMVIGPTNALTKKQIKWNCEVWARILMEHATTTDAMDTRSIKVGN